MRKLTSPIALGLALLCSAPVYSQVFPSGALPGLARNGVTSLHAEGNRLFAGPVLVFTDDGLTFVTPDPDVFFPQGIRNARVYSIDASGDRVLVGLGFIDRTNELSEPIQTAASFAVSQDGGNTWTYRLPALDALNDTSIVYGINRLRALPISEPQGSPPYSVAVGPRAGEAWAATGFAGLRQSRNGGQSWRPVVLPPDTLDSISPILEYDFVYAPAFNPNIDLTLNLIAFAVLVDETGTVWAGTAAGLNRSRPEDIYTFTNDAGVEYESRAWTRRSFDGTLLGLPGDQVIGLAEQLRPGERSAIWAATWRISRAQEQFGVVVTRDGGETFEPALLGEPIYDFAFRGSTVYAAGVNGLFISEDDGATWRGLRRFPDAADPSRNLMIRPDAVTFSVATTPEALWVGTDEGLLKSTDGGATFSLFRTDVSTRPETPSAEAPAVDAYAYPNPFSPRASGLLRIRYDLDAPEDVTVRIFDFGMNLVRNLPGGSRPAGPVEEQWDGLSNAGARVANGVYVYVVSGPSGRRAGTILVLE